MQYREDIRQRDRKNCKECQILVSDGNLHTGNLWVQDSNRTQLSTGSHKSEALCRAHAFSHVVKAIKQESLNNNRS